MSETPLTRPRAYLEAVTVGLSVANPRDLPLILREVARNICVLADEAERELEETANAAKFALIERADGE